MRTTSDFLDTILLGVPARPMPFILSDTDLQENTEKSKDLTQQTVIDNFQQIIVDFSTVLLFTICIMLSRVLTANPYQFPLIIPIFLLIYSLIIPIVYTYLVTNQVDGINTNWRIKLAMALFEQYTKYVGKLLSGTQFLVLVLREFGARIKNDVIIDDMNSLYDVHLITIGSHTRLSTTCQIQVKNSQAILYNLLLSLF